MAHEEPTFNPSLVNDLLGEGGLPEGKISTISLLTTSYLAVLTGCVPSPKTVGGRRFPSSEHQQFSTNSASSPSGCGAPIP